MLKVLFLIIILFSSHSYAYLGPGIGGGIIFVSLGILFSILALLFGIIWFPIKKFLKQRKNKKNDLV